MKNNMMSITTCAQVQNIFMHQVLYLVQYRVSSTRASLHTISQIESAVITAPVNIFCVC